MDAVPVCDGNTGHVKRFFLFLLVDVQRMCRGLVSETGTDKWDEQVPRIGECYPWKKPWQNLIAGSSTQTG